MSDACVTVNAPHVIHETIDGEVIVINLATGTYYSLKGSAAELWQLIQEPRGAREQELVEALAAGYDSSTQTFEAALEPFLAQLIDEGLVARTSPTNGEGPVQRTDWESNGHPAERQAFTPPVLEKFTDMQDLVLLDPVHEVDETGWPQRADAAAGA